MNLYIRFFKLLVKRFFGKNKLEIFSCCKTPFFVWPLDIDLNFHMNNGRYLSIMDIGRFDLLLKCRTFWPLLRKGYYPVVASESIRFRKSLTPFQPFELHTQLESWDDKDFFISQKFLVKQTIYAEGYIRARFKKRGVPGSITTDEIFDVLGEVRKPNRMTKKAMLQKELEGHLALKTKSPKAAR